MAEELYQQFVVGKEAAYKAQADAFPKDPKETGAYGLLLPSKDGAVNQFSENSEGNPDAEKRASEADIQISTPSLGMFREAIVAENNNPTEASINSVTLAPSGKMEYSVSGSVEINIPKDGNETPLLVSSQNRDKSETKIGGLADGQEVSLSSHNPYRVNSHQENQAVSDNLHVSVIGLSGAKLRANQQNIDETFHRVGLDSSGGIARDTTTLDMAGLDKLSMKELEKLRDCFEVRGGIIESNNKATIINSPDGLTAVPDKNGETVVKFNGVELGKISEYASVDVTPPLSGQGNRGAEVLPPTR